MSTLSKKVGERGSVLVALVQGDIYRVTWGKWYCWREVYFGLSTT